MKEIISNDTFHEALAHKFDDLLSSINLYIWRMNQSQGVEVFAFRWILEPDSFHDFEKGVLNDKDIEYLLIVLDQLGYLWRTYSYWYYNGKLLPYEKWKIIYNCNYNAVSWNSILLA